MKIFFFISIHTHGMGGSMRSLDHISREIGKHNNNVKVITIGSHKSDLLELNPFFYKHIFFNGLNFFNLFAELSRIRKDFNPDYYHCFDIDSYNIVRLLISSQNHKIILTKCGGPNLKPKNSPHVSNLILFSSENEISFKLRDKYKGSNIFLIPNRVKALVIDKDFKPFKKNEGDFIFMRICRIGVVYEKSIRDSMNLIKLLIPNTTKVIKLIVIGLIEDNDVYEKLTKDELVRDGHVIFLTSSIYTFEASKALYLADAVIGVGRGFMEAASINKPLLAINRNEDIPVLIDNSNFKEAFRTNFSQRNIFSSETKKKNILNINKLVRNGEYYKNISNFSKDCFEEYFNVERVPELYNEVYKNSLFSKRKLISDSYVITRSVWHFYLNWRKKL